MQSIATTSRSWLDSLYNPVAHLIICPIRAGFEKMEKKTIIVIAVVAAVLIVIGGGLSVMIGVGKAIVEDKGTLEAETSYAEKISTNTGTQTAGSGKVFIVALVTITNDKADDGISNNCYNLQIKSNNITYQCDSWNTITINHEYRYELKTIGKGASDTSCYVFEIPKEGMDKAEILYDGSYSLTCKTTYKGEAVITPMGTYKIVVSSPSNYELKDGSLWTPEADMKFVELKVTMTCNFDKVSTHWGCFDVILDGKQYWMYADSKNIMVDPYVETDLTKGQTLTTTQVYQMPIDADISKISITWNKDSVSMEGTVTINA